MLTEPVGSRDAEEYHRVVGSCFRLGPQGSIFQSSEIDRPIALDLVTTNVLDHCPAVGRLEAHVEAVVNRVPRLSPQVIRSTVTNLVALGLLTRGRPGAARASTRREAGQPDEHTITAIGIATADRPAALRRCVSSVMAHCRGHGKAPRIIVVDGSKDPAHLAANQSMIEQAGPDADCDLSYVGAEASRSLQSRFLSLGFSEPVVKSMVSPGGQGAGRNLLMLMTMGEDIMFVDDDVICTPWAPANRRAGVAVAGHGDPRQIAHFSDRAAALSATVPADVDLLAAHGRLLGRDLRSLLDRPDSDVDLSLTCGHLLKSLAHERRHVVKATFTGVAGDPGLYCPHRSLFRGGPGRGLMSDPIAFERAMTRREVVRVAPQDTVTHHPHLMSYCMALSNRGLLPPFVPFGRNEDGLFAEMLTLIDPEALFGHVSHGIVHDSDRDSAYPVAAVSASETRLSDLLLALIRLNPPNTRGGSPSARLAHVARCLTEVADQEPREFMSLCAETMLEVRCSELASAWALAQDPACPPHWRDALKRYHQAFLRGIESPRFFLPIEFHERCRDTSVDGGFRALHEFIRTFAEFLQLWPSLRGCARPGHSR